MTNQSPQLLTANLMLIQAIADKDRQAIIDAYDYVREINMVDCDHELLQEYDALVEQANDILYS